MTLPTSSDIPRIADQLELAVAWLRDQAPAALKARHVNRSEIPQPLEVDKVQLTAVEAAANAALADEWLVKQQQALRHTIGVLWDNACAAVEGIHRINQRTTPPTRDLSSEVTYCVEMHCEDESSLRHAGRCEPCYDWRRRNPDHDGPVPKHVISHRVKLRDNKRVRVSGPMTGEVA